MLATLPQMMSIDGHACALNRSAPLATVGAGRSRWTRAGAEGPIEVRVLYKGLAGYEAHQARISCALDKGGQVQALSAY